MATSQQLDELELGAVGVLVLVHHDVAVPLAPLGPHPRVFGPELHGEVDEVVEVDPLYGAQGALVQRVEVGARVAGRLLLQLAGRNEAVLGVVDAAEHPVRTPLLGVHPLLVHEPLEQRALVGGVEDGEALGDAQVADVLPQHRDAEAVEGGQPDAAGLGADQTVHPLAHLGSGLVGEGHGEEVRGVHAPGLDQVGEAVGENTGLA